MDYLKIVLKVGTAAGVNFAVKKVERSTFNKVRNNKRGFNSFLADYAIAEESSLYRKGKISNDY